MTYFMRFFFPLCCLLILAACTKNAPSGQAPVQRFAYPEASPTALNFLKTQLALDTLWLPANIHSTVGHYFISDGQLHFADEVNAQVVGFTPEGQPTQRYLGRGQGPSEVANLQGIALGQDQYYAWAGYDVEVLAKNWMRQSFMRLDFQENPETEGKVNPEKPGLYEVRYFKNRPFFTTSGYLAYHIESTHPAFNAFVLETAATYFKSAPIFGLANLQNGKVEKLIGNYPPYYQANPNHPNFSYWDVARGNGSNFLAFEADSLIYELDGAFRIVRAFGRAGRQMKTDYPKTFDYESAEDRFFDDRAKFGFYDGLFYSSTSGLLFRTYFTGNPASNGENDRRMQVYQGLRLVADLDVPERFGLIGELNGLIYADGLLPSEKGGSPALFWFRW